MAVGRSYQRLLVVFALACFLSPSTGASGNSAPATARFVINGGGSGPADPPSPRDPPDPEPTVRLMAVGDVSLGWQVGRKITRRGPQAPWTGAHSYFDQADLVVANLECTISTRGSPWPSKVIHLRAPVAAADSLVAGGIDFVSVANNHALDFGQDGFADTLRLLDERQIGYFGGGTDYASAHAPRIAEQNGLRIAFLAYVLPFSSKTTFSTREWAAGAHTPGLAIAVAADIRRDVASAKLDSDLVVVVLHSGTEYRSRPITAQRVLAQAAVDAGATLVIESGPHVLQGYHQVDGTLIAYSLGNFVFARFDGVSNDTAILDVTLTPHGVSSFSWIPMVIEGGVPRPAVGSEIDRVMSRLRPI